VLGRFDEWIQRYPDLNSVARASLQQVLSAWEGLGYYARARRLHRTARLVVQRHGGRLPRAGRDLQELPGIGPYIAAAIRSLAFGEPDVAVEANVMRVFLRLLGLERRPSESSARQVVSRYAARALPPQRPADFNQALMDFGSLLCRPRRPQCGQCFAAGLCVARRRGRQELIPRRRRRRLERISTAVAVFRRDGSIYVQRRPPEGLFGGMWEFPGGKVEDGETPAQALVREIREELGVTCTPGHALEPILHYYTRFRVTLHGFLGPPPAGLPVDETHRWVTPRESTELPMPAASRRLVGRLEGRRR
jgi:A/G-specific adenine glycosylase